MKLTSNALEYMQRIAKKCGEDDYRHMKTMMFDKGESAPVHHELKAVGLIRQMGTKGSAWVLTDAGAAWVMENRDV